MWECRVGCCWLMQVGILRKAQSKQVETRFFLIFWQWGKWVAGWSRSLHACYALTLVLSWGQIKLHLKLKWTCSQSTEINLDFLFFKFFKCFQLLKCQASTFLFQVCDRKLYPDFFTFLWHLITKANPRLNKKSMGRLIHNENTVN